MAVSVNWTTRIITVPQADLTFLGGVIYQLDVDALRLELKALEDDEGMPFLDTHRHNTEVVLSGVTYARTVEIINNYRIEFENGSYTVSATGANHNIGDVMVPNNVSLIVNNSAGLQGVSGLTDEQAQCLRELCLIHGLIDGDPANISKTSIAAGEVNISVATDGTTVTKTRVP